MSSKNKLLATAVLAGCITLASLSSLAAQEMPGEFHTVYSGKFGGSCYTSADKDKLADEIQKEIKNAAIHICASRDFSIDKPKFTISQNHFVLDECDRNFTMSGTATVFCRD